MCQFLKLISHSGLSKLANEHHSVQKFRKFTIVLILLTLLVSGRNSIRDVIENLKVQSQKLFHIGKQLMSRSSFSRINNEQPWQLYQFLLY